MLPDPASFPGVALDSERAAALIRAAGARATPARVQVLRVLAAAPAPMTHQEIEGAFAGAPLDRVTLYRVLDWLVAAGLASKVADARRVFRFALAHGGAHAGHAHFRCEGCGRVFCLDAPVPALPALPAGFVLTRAELDLSGRCAGCARSA